MSQTGPVNRKREIPTQLLYHGRNVVKRCRTLLDAIEKGQKEIENSAFNNDILAQLDWHMRSEVSYLRIPTDIVKKILSMLSADECWSISLYLNKDYNAWVKTRITWYRMRLTDFDLEKRYWLRSLPFWKDSEWKKISFTPRSTDDKFQQSDILLRAWHVVIYHQKEDDRLVKRFNVSIHYPNQPLEFNWNPVTLGDGATNLNRQTLASVDWIFKNKSQ